MTHEETKQRLAEIERAIKGGAKYEKYEKELNQLLGIPEEIARDYETEEKWENEYRNNRETD